VKLIRIGCFLVLIAMLVLYGVVVSKPPKLHQQTVDAALASLAKRRAARKPLLEDPAANGFLNPKLNRFWSRGRDNGGPVKDTITGWANNFSDQGAGHHIDHAALQKSKNPGYQTLRLAFIGLLPDLVAAFTKPVFQPVNEEVHVANDVALRSLTLAINGYAESLVAQHLPDQAALAYELAFREGYLFSDDVNMVHAFQGIGFQALAFQSLVATLQPDANLTAAQWAELSKAAAATSPTPVTITQALQHDLAIGTAFLSQPRGSFEDPARYLRGVYLLPGLQARDLRIYHNTMGLALEESLTGSVKTGNPPDTLSEYLKGNAGSGTGVLLPPGGYPKQSARVGLHSAKMGGLSAMAAVCAFRAKNGRLPTTLAQVGTLGLKAPGGLSWSTVKGFYYKVEGKKALVGVLVPARQFADAGLDVDAASRLEAENSRYFRLQESGLFFHI
jgi:hypothetical protein